MDAQEFIFNVPLYQKIKINEENNFLNEIVLDDGRFEGYNPIRHKESTFVMYDGLCGGDRNMLSISRVLSMELACCRYRDRLFIYVYWDAEDKTITKIGQYPSVADIHIGQIKQYDKVLQKESLREFTRAIGLAANGVGIGSFVYLRRIFENLISEVAEKSIANDNDKKTFMTARMDEKIDMIKDFLPPFLVENKNIYKILSKGIHELSEKSCLAYFDVMRSSIELILDQRLEEIRKKEKEQKAQTALNNIAASIKK